MTGELGERLIASPAISRGIFLRSDGALFGGEVIYGATSLRAPLESP
jgi:hypothetical protein